MIATAWIFTTGNSQAIRLPKAFRLDIEEVRIRKSSDGVLTIQPKPEKDEIEAFLAELRAMPKTEDFLRPGADPPRPIPFWGWVE